MFGTEGDGEENGNGLSAVCSVLLCFHWIERVGIYIAFWSCGGPSQRKPIENSFWLGIVCIDITKSELNGGVAYGFAVFLSHSGKKRTIPMIVYLFKVSYDSLWCQSLMVWYTAFCLLLPLFSMLNLHKISNRYINWLLFNANCHLYSLKEMLFP